MPEPQVLLSLRGLKKTFDTQEALAGLDLDVYAGEFITLLGPSGCGKTTTLRIIAGLELPTEGSVHLDGEDITHLAPEKRAVNTVFQNYALFPHMNVYKNIAYGLSLRGVSRQETAEKVRRMLELVQLQGYEKRLPSQLSGGQRQRVAIGRAIVREPQVFLMDEPLSNLDAKLRNQMRAEIILLRRRLDTTFVYVTHDQTEAMTLGDRIVIMKDGFIQQVGTPQEVFDMPQNLFVAGFIGSPQMNIFDAHLTAQGGNYTVELPGFRLELDGQRAALLKNRNIASQPVKLGVRPEHAQVRFEGQGPGLEGTIAVNEMMGSELHLHVLREGEQNVILRVPTVDLSPAQREALNAGNTIRFSFQSKVVQLFDPQTEQSLLF